MRVPPSRARVLATIAVALVVCACAGAPATPPSSPAGSSSSTAVATPPMTPSPSAASLPRGTWEGVVGDGPMASPMRMWFEACRVGSRCGAVEYLDPEGSVFCASELTLDAVDGDQAVFSEAMVYQGWKCLETTIAARSAGDALEVEQGDGTTVCCRGTLRRVSADVVKDPLPSPGPHGDLASSTSVIALGGFGTQYGAVAAGSFWMPLDNLGAVGRVDLDSGGLVATIPTGDPWRVAGLKTDPHGVAADGDWIWVAMAAERSVGRIDPATNTVVETIAIDAVPYALAIGDGTLWAASFENDVVVGVDLPTSSVIGRVPAAKPTGIAVGAGGVWVVLHREDAVVRIDPATRTVVARISYGDRGPNETCGRCIENVVVADGVVWTADNHGRTVTRIDPATNSIAATIPFESRPWQVTAGGGFVWAGLLEESSRDVPDPRGIGRIGPGDRVDIVDAPVFAATWGGDAL